MRKRLGFVSNSSSSSFVVVPDGVLESDDTSSTVESYDRMRVLLAFDDGWRGLFENGEMSFEWQVVKYHDMESKWNWLVLQAFNGGDKYIRMIDDYLESIGTGLKVDWLWVEMMTDKLIASIDHQSVDAESTFSEVEKVGFDRFLSDDRCYIHNSNDNYGDDTRAEERW